MSRELKFRAWDGQEMHKTVCINHLQEAIKYGYRATDWSEDAKAGIPMQYSGIKDIQDKEIYEGDIIRFNDEEGESLVAEVIFESCMFCVIWLDNIRTIDYLDQVEVIGNIYQNPELLNHQ